MTAPILPANHQGISTDTISAKEFSTIEEAANYFGVVKSRFINVNGWHELAGTATASFHVYNMRGERVSRPPQEGDYFCIDIPAPASEAGNGADWVQVRRIQHSSTPGSQYMSIEVQPCANPLTPSQETAHFFDEAASSTFLITQKGNKVTAEVHGRNEKPNNTEVSMIDKIRNTIVAIGAMLGFSKLQWKSLTDALVA